MPPSVIQLPAQLANQIAAGEVVLRPANAVKELIENAIDADARNIRVETDGGGVRRIAVIDDGHGMRQEDAILAIRRHATSKLKSADDLMSIHTLGFRGEALPSIASVSRFALRTRTHDIDQGSEIRIEGGAPAAISPCGCAPGTTVEVADLFYNVPARRKFLRAMSTESAHVTEAFVAAALTQAEIAMVLVRDGRVVKRHLRMPDREQRVRDILAAHDIVVCQGMRGPINIEAYLAPAAQARNRANGLRVFVNERPVQDRALSRAVASAYGDSLAQGAFPVGTLFISISPSLVDVNVHPQKAQVRFAHARAVTDAVYAVVANTMQTSSLGFQRPPSTGTTTALAAESENWVWRDSVRPRETYTSSDLAPRPDPPIAAQAGPHSTHDETFDSWQLLTVLRDRFLVCRGEPGIFVVDRTAAQITLARDAARRYLDSGTLPSQRLLFPVSQDVDEKAACCTERASNSFNRLGVDLRRSAPHTIMLHAVPRALANANPEALSKHLIDIAVAQFTSPEDEPALDPSNLLAIFDHLLTLLPAGAAQNREQSQLLLQELERTGLAEAGSPNRSRIVVAEISSEMLERQHSEPW